MIKNTWGNYLENHKKSVHTHIHIHTCNTYDGSVRINLHQKCHVILNPLNLFSKEHMYFKKCLRWVYKMSYSGSMFMLGPTDFHCMSKNSLNIFQNMYCVPQKKDKQIRNDMRVRKGWKNLHLWVNCLFKMFKTKAVTDPLEHSLSLSLLAMPSVMERSGSGVLSRSRAKTVTNGNSQHSEEESSDEEHTHGESDTFTHKLQLQTTICTFIHLHGSKVSSLIVSFKCKISVYHCLSVYSVKHPCLFLLCPLWGCTASF